ncbi:ABC transporter permease [Burkholderia mallei]|uniref:ABC transporter, carbohydrate uptake transporter-2 (CUT2) family, permease protein n=3 Tax=Burkholderia mallei TaxID=13373 RepID=A2RYY5_BURM9|nr:ABC transporter permease [Burkholderia mallei]ABM99886.2 ABC transporter, carbohydrate uptake transporter-2 (CUT2) family, permease protein [Burkholderia mallei NCTC 10229]AIW47793.1 sugar ABC transporter permease [Burkholderia mallei]AOP69679.1 sugar ABC transporter permease [Burkholderia mallei]ATD91859.1 sugar ABC transporter permease [Burkholderia mallei]ATD95537.1 sugar ABC transporter permease [Burkholderia mallei]
MNKTMNTQTLSRLDAAPRRVNVAELASRFGIPIVFVALCVVLAFASPYFLTWRNWSDILRQTSINGILAIGMTYVILTKGIDLSVGSVLALAGIVSGLAGAAGHGLAVSLAAGVACGAALGAINGVAIARLNVPPFVATLGMLSVARGVTYIANDGSPVANLPDDYLSLGIGRLGPLGMPVLIFAGVALACWWVLRYTTYGRYLYAVGGNEKSARTTSALPQAGVSYELDAIAAVVIGGTSLSGGQGGVVGTLFGALLIGVINNGLNLLGVSSYYQQIAKGLIIVLAVLIDVARKQQR